VHSGTCGRNLGNASLAYVTSTACRFSARTGSPGSFASRHCEQRPRCKAAKKRGRISCPSRNDHQGLLRLLLSDSYHLRTLCCTPIRTAVTGLMTARSRASARNSGRRWCFGNPAVVPLLREIRGFASLSRDRCALSCSQSSGLECFYTGTNQDCCRLNLLLTQGGQQRCPYERAGSKPAQAPRLSLPILASLALRSAP
jgi:hypothetical protein